MRITAQITAGPGPARHHGPPAAARENAGAAPRAALPAVIAEPRRDNPAAPRPTRPVTALLAQILAGAEDMPASRARRRADPAAGADAYRTMAGLGPDRPLRDVRSI